jgi:diguanylate cyclase (GGDEF)-like protein
MTKAVSIDNSHASPAIPSGAQSRRGCTHAAPRALSNPAVRKAARLERELAASRQQLSAALCRIDALQTQGSLLRNQLASLERAVAQARQFAYHDELTGLPNRRLLADRYNQAVALATRQHRQVALLFLDLNGFKGINDAHGHAAGDRVLQQVATRLRACIRSSDTACRYGGDEFVVLLPELEGPGRAVAAAGKIRARLAAPYVVDGARIAVTASIGMAVYPVDGRKYGDLMHVTDGFMYRDKGSDRDVETPGSHRHPPPANPRSGGRKVA